MMSRAWLLGSLLLLPLFLVTSVAADGAVSTILLCYGKPFL